MMKIAIFASSNGSNFEAIIQYFRHLKNTKIKKHNLHFVLVTNNKHAYAIKRAKRLKIKHFFVEHENLSNFLTQNKFDLCVLSGYMRIVEKNSLATSTFINIHPSLLPNYKGKNAIKRIYKDKSYNSSGISIHYVNEFVDDGKIIFQKKSNLTETQVIHNMKKKYIQLNTKCTPRL
ncbi:MAG: hypothetical protein L6V95_08295 [Candidatus Melainabacteria bacterium]|nr:MAG: hypothetical protein L6V95_08295 [Candidatus Melainabacteria bacterium]